METIGHTNKLCHWFIDVFSEKYPVTRERDKIHCGCCGSKRSAVQDIYKKSNKFDFGFSPTEITYTYIMETSLLPTTNEWLSGIGGGEN